MHSEATPASTSRTCDGDPADDAAVIAAVKARLLDLFVKRAHRHAPAPRNGERGTRSPPLYVEAGADGRARPAAQGHRRVPGRDRRASTSSTSGQTVGDLARVERARISTGSMFGGAADGVAAATLEEQQLGRAHVAILVERLG